MSGDCCVSIFFQRSVDRRHNLMCFQSEDSVFKFIGLGVDAAQIFRTLMDSLNICDIYKVETTMNFP